MRRQAFKAALVVVFFLSVANASVIMPALALDERAISSDEGGC
jgi:hypothetical protein